LLPSLKACCREVIAGLKELDSGRTGYWAGAPNIIKKEVQLVGGKMKIGSLSSAAATYFWEKCLEEMFEIELAI